MKQPIHNELSLLRAEPEPSGGWICEFDGYRFDSGQGVLIDLRDGRALHLGPHAAAALRLLLRNPGELVEKDELMRCIWPHVVVEENNLTQAIHSLRQVLGERPHENRYIATVPRRGYRFVAEVRLAGLPALHSARGSPATDLRPVRAAAARWRHGPLIAALGVMLAALLLAGAWRLRQRAAEDAGISPRSIAVIPFDNLSGDVSKRYLGAGLAAQVIESLNRVPGLTVTPYDQSAAFEGRSIDAAAIGRTLRVRFVLHGSTRWTAGHVQVAVQLRDTRESADTWSHTYEKSSVDLFELQSEIASAVQESLHMTLPQGSPLVVNRAAPTADMAAYDQYLQATSLLEHPSERNVARAQQLFQQALDRDPRFAQALSGLARSHMIAWAFLGKDEVAEAPLADSAARRALELDPNSAMAHEVLAALAGTGGRWVDMEEHFQQALAEAPNEALIRCRHAVWLALAGRLSDAEAEFRRSYELNPGNAINLIFFARFLAHTGRDADARRYLGLAVDMGYPEEGGLLPNTQAWEQFRAGHSARAASRVDLVGLLYVRDELRSIALREQIARAMVDPAQRAAAAAAALRLYPARPALPAAGHLAASSCLRAAYLFVLSSQLDAAYQLADRCQALSPDSGTLGPGLWSPEMRPFRRDARFAAYVGRSPALLNYWRRYGAPDQCRLVGNALACE